MIAFDEIVDSAMNRPLKCINNFFKNCIKSTPYEKRICEYVAKIYSLDPSDQFQIEQFVNKEA